MKKIIMVVLFSFVCIYPAYSICSGIPGDGNPYDCLKMGVNNAMQNQQYQYNLQQQQYLIQQQSRYIQAQEQRNLYNYTNSFAPQNNLPHTYNVNVRYQAPAYNLR